MPVTPKGSHIHLWPPLYEGEFEKYSYDIEGEVFHIPYGYMMLFQGDTPHAVGYR